MHCRQWCGKVIVAHSHEQLHVGILGKGASECRACIRVSIVDAPVPLPDPSAKRVILEVALVAELGANVVVECCGEWRPDRDIARIKIGPGPDTKLINPDKPAVEPPHAAALVSDQLFLEQGS